MIASPPPTARRHRPYRPEQALLPLMAAVARVYPSGLAGVPAVLDSSARGFGHADWAEMFRSLPKFRGLEAGAKGKSGNHPHMACSVALYHPATVEAAVEEWRFAGELSHILGFELNEPGSRLEYGAWRLAAVLLVLAWAELHPEQLTSADLAMLHGWLRLFLARAAVAGFHPPGRAYRSLVCGARSGGFTSAIVADVAASLALDLPPVWRARSGYPPFWRNQELWLVFSTFRAALRTHGALARRIWQAIGAGSNDTSWVSALPPWPSSAVTWYRRTTEGLAVWLDEPELGPGNDDVKNENTRGVAAMVAYSAGEVWTLPPQPEASVRIRGRRVIESIEQLPGPGVAARQLRYTQGGAARAMTVTLDLPAGELLYLLRHGPDGWVRLA